MFPPQKRRRLSSLPSRGYKSTTPMKSDPIGPLGLSGFALQPYEMLPRSFCSNVPGSATPLREPPGDKVPFLAAWGLSSSSAMAWGSWGGGGGEIQPQNGERTLSEPKSPSGAHRGGSALGVRVAPRRCQQQKGDGTQEGTAGSAARSRHGTGMATGGRRAHPGGWGTGTGTPGCRGHEDGGQRGTGRWGQGMGTGAGDGRGWGRRGPPGPAARSAPGGTRRHGDPTGDCDPGSAAPPGPHPPAGSALPRPDPSGTVPSRPVPSRSSSCRRRPARTGNRKCCTPPRGRRQLFSDWLRCRRSARILSRALM